MSKIYETSGKTENETFEQVNGYGTEYEIFSFEQVNGYGTEYEIFS